MDRRLQSLPLAEFWGEPSLRVLSSFFLGGLFLLSLYYIIQSPTLQTAFKAIGRLFTPSPKHMGPQALEEDAEEKARLRRWIEEAFLGPSENLDPKNLVLILTLFSANASAALAGSTLIYEKGQDILCTFSIAWGELSAEMIRIVGFIRLSLDLRELGAYRWEMYLSWLYVLGIAGVKMADVVLSPALLRTSYSLQGLALCYRQHYTELQLLQSILNNVFEFYAIIRLAIALVPTFLQPRHKLHALADIRLGKALALLLMDATVLVPNAIPISIAADFIPFALTAVPVLAAFNYDQARVVSSLSRMDSIPSTRMMRIFGSSSTTGVRTPTSVRSLRRGSTITSRPSVYRQRRSLDVPPFSLSMVTEERSKGKGLKELDITMANALPISPRSTQRKGHNTAVTGYSGAPTSPERVGRSSMRRSADIPKASSTHRSGMQEPVKPFGSYSDSPSPRKELPPIPTIQNTEVEDVKGKRNGIIPMSKKKLSRPSMKSDVEWSERPYDLAKDVGEYSLTSNGYRSGVSPCLSPRSPGERWSNEFAWSRQEDHLSIVHERRESGKGSGKSYMSPKSLNKSIFGTNSSLNSRVRSRAESSRRRSSMDYTKITPYIIDDQLPSPSTAPASHVGIEPVVELKSPGALEHGEWNAVATGVSGRTESMSTPRVKFGARPMRMRSALLEERYLPGTLPRRMLAGSHEYDKIK